MSAVHLSPPVTTVISCSQPPDQESSTSTAAASTSVDAPSTCTSSTSGFSMSSYLMDSQVSRAEILYCLKIVKSHASMRSADDSCELFRALFPNLKVAEKLSLGRTKASYIINYELAKFFAPQLEDKLKSTESFVICFDDSLNRVVQRGQMDLVVRYFDDAANQVITKCFTSVLLGRATATDLLAKFKEGIASLPRSKLMQISMDGPSVNWLFLDKYTMRI
jgi:hypothetical protein